MSHIGKKILIVDDEEYNLDILNEHLKDSGHITILARNGVEALAQLEHNMPIDVILLDRMMPIMDGMEFMKHIKADERYRNIPVIMQTAASTTEQIIEGISAGVFYYLTKPYEKITLITVLNSALEQQIVQQKTDDETNNHKHGMKLLEHASFTFRTLEEAKYVSFTISNVFAEPEKIVFGLNELTINAVEHGNLGISFEEKKKFIRENAWQDEINRRLKMPEYSARFATLTFRTFPKHYEITIKDMGDGFDHERYTNFDSKRITDPSGRGIAMARIYSFSDVEYNDKGNEVTCKVRK